MAKSAKAVLIEHQGPADKADDAPVAPIFVRSIPIHDLNRPDLEVISPIQVEIELYTDEVVCRIPELDIWTSEENESEALLAIKEAVYDLWEELQHEDDDSLGRLPRMWKRILNHKIIIRGKMA
ncbi:MAG: hypothetical protein NTX50_05470 [Candidatus Sumerlaeota bacterium]|nr:hypothetical protein [Candidatus Sumerlaeota bacterium]